MNEPHTIRLIWPTQIDIWCTRSLSWQTICLLATSLNRLYLKSYSEHVCFGPEGLLCMFLYQRPSLFGHVWVEIIERILKWIMKKTLEH
ncbi:hypothetical protein BH18ACI4_BH18ACI4_02950 [soil metagenome]